MMTHRLAFACVLLCAASLPAQGGSVLLRAGTVITVSGEVFTPGAVLITDGVIAAIGREVAEPAGVQVISHPDGVMVPGLVDSACGVGVRRWLRESQHDMLAALRVADALDAADPFIQRHLSAGITTWVLQPEDGNMLRGRAAVVSASASGALRVLRAEAGLKLCLRESTYERDAVPTSLMGVLALLETEAPATYSAAAGIERGLIIACDDDREVRAALRLASHCAAKPMLHTQVDATECAAAAAKAFAGTVFGPVLPEFGDRFRAVPARYSAAGCAIAFSSGAPALPAETLRLSAVTACIGGLAPEAALRALTLGAAELAGVADKVGSLASGKEGDVLIYSRHPTDPRAQLLRVVQDGVVLGKE